MSYPRHGKTLIEMLVVMSVMSTALFGSATIIHTMLRSEGMGADALVGQTALARFARDLRRDVHAAVAAEPATDGVPGAVRCTLRLPQGGVVRYLAANDGLVRVESRNDQPLNRETYRLPEGDTQFLLESQPPFVVATHHWHVAAPSGRPTVTHEFRIEAGLSTDLRFEAHR